MVSSLRTAISRGERAGGVATVILICCLFYFVVLTLIGEGEGEGEGLRREMRRIVGKI
jgi:hypothetical protein